MLLQLLEQDLLYPSCIELCQMAGVQCWYSLAQLPPWPAALLLLLSCVVELQTAAGVQSSLLPLFLLIHACLLKVLQLGSTQLCCRQQ